MTLYLCKVTTRDALRSLGLKQCLHNFVHGTPRSPVEDASWSTDLAPASKYYSPETPLCELIEKDYLTGSGLGDGTPMIQCANDSHRLLDLRFIDPFKTEYKLMNDVPDLDTPMYSKSKFYEMFVLLRKRSYPVDFLTSPTIGNPVTPNRENICHAVNPARIKSGQAIPIRLGFLALEFIGVLTGPSYINNFQMLCYD